MKREITSDHPVRRRKLWRINQRYAALPSSRSCRGQHSGAAEAVGVQARQGKSSALGFNTGKKLHAISARDMAVRSAKREIDRALKAQQR